MTDEQSIALNAGSGYPGSNIRNLYFNGKLAMRMGFTESVYPSMLILPDQIGSSRVTVGLINGQGSPGPGQALMTTTDFYPFGAYVNPPATNLEQQFTGKERDSESGNDYFEARYYSSAMGRFMSPDWGVHIANPQSLNLYSYAGNSPLDRVDTDGHDWSDGMQGSSHSGPGSLMDAFQADLGSSGAGRSSEFAQNNFWEQFDDRLGFSDESAG